jgi:hypothetical protein
MLFCMCAIVVIKTIWTQGSQQTGSAARSHDPILSLASMIGRWTLLEPRDARSQPPSTPQRHRCWRMVWDSAPTARTSGSVSPWLANGTPPGIIAGFDDRCAPRCVTTPLNRFATARLHYSKVTALALEGRRVISRDWLGVP